ncbi:hypothetical protein CHS0354_026000 [Potamilus streckersoni]|uniref:Large ribosomal subunit protein mL51 n=1 Tax=Potamilus streckersoni TaxID=2493646 RepID=A0AAE0RYD8_9BIVA|nr:hypothetical protein CHS0354_026000 [Potamilus streckersoni]
MFSWLKPATVFLRQSSFHQLHTGLKSLPLFKWKTLENSEQLCSCKAVVYASLPCRSSSSLSPEDKFFAPSPYRKKVPKRYGYENKLFDGGPLPRLDEPIKSLKPYKPKDSWSKDRALFGQNDYIDILGDGSVVPKDLIRGPRWLLGWRGNEFQRLIRKMKTVGHLMRDIYPTYYHNNWKRIKFLYKKYNIKRGKRVR